MTIIICRGSGYLGKIISRTCRTGGGTVLCTRLIVSKCGCGKKSSLGGKLLNQTSWRSYALSTAFQPDYKIMPAHPPAIVSAPWLHQRLSSNDRALRVLDVSYYKDREAKEDYKKVHIPRAGFFDFFHGVESTEYIPRNIPHPAVFEKYVRSFGISDDTHTVLYDNSGNFGYYIGSRVWWLFRLYGATNVSILDGGLDRWLAGGYEVSSVEPTFRKGNFTVKQNGSLKKSYEDLVANTRSKAFQVLDARAKEVFDGNPEDKRSGHIPGAINVPVGLMTDEDNQVFQEPQQIEKVFSEAGVDVDKPMLMMCHTGTTACSLALGAYQCGIDNVPIYLGSWTEWTQRADPSLIEQTVPDSEPEKTST